MKGWFATMIGMAAFALTTPAFAATASEEADAPQASDLRQF